MPITQKMPSDLYGIDNLCNFGSPLKAENNRNKQMLEKHLAQQHLPISLQKSIKLKSNPNGKEQVHRFGRSNQDIYTCKQIEN